MFKISKPKINEYYIWILIVEADTKEVEVHTTIGSLLTTISGLESKGIKESDYGVFNLKVKEVNE